MAPRTIYLLSRLHYMLRQKIDRLLADTGITAVHYTIMSMLKSRNTLSSAEIARRYYVTPQSMNEIISSLERQGLVSRMPSTENRRILLVRLTERGSDLLARCDAIADEVEGELTSVLDPDRRAAFRDMLQEIWRHAVDGKQV